uniref:Solute carrier family 5 member 5 n=2 Tax=Eptatretus burgeri TaxID=7764 RepID=A0A8C4RAV3_EPTBU
MQFYRFPAEVDRRHLWISVLRREKWRPGEPDWLCGLRFVSAIGMYHACRRGRGELFSSERNLGAVSVGLSLTSTFMSAAQVLGVPSETYLFGAKFLQMCLGQSINVVITVIIFLPVFYRLRIKTTNKYLEMRFNKTVKMYGFILYIFATVFYTGIIIYAPAVILNRATKLNIWMLVLTTGIVCTLYTTMGGMRAVVWTDVLQTLLMVSGFWVFTVRGIFRVGGIQKVWQAVYNGGRINFGDFNPDPTQRYTFWTLLLGGSLVWLAMYGVNQAQVQRYISCSSERSARWALFINLAGLWTVVGSAVCCGLVMFAFYKDCDPIKARILSATDQVQYMLLIVLNFLLQKRH